eukprot:PLAT11304.1.p1 GENE.PLAT11304.1~~PLAT11304.1.p1  ORF type:complete len:348 (+),score=144.78 PLAT11304.1:193-1236(+)
MSDDCLRGRALVAGGAGFLGSHLCDRLVEDGWHVVAFDSFVTGSEENVAHLLGNPRFTLCEGDVRDEAAIAAAAGEGITRVYNLACAAAPIHYQSMPTATLMTSVLGCYNLARFAVKCGARLLQASTSEVYGDPEVHPQPEGYRGSVSCTGPRACYDEGKRAAEALLFDARREWGLDLRIVRIFNTYGPRMHPWDGRVVSNFVRQALLGESLTVYGDGSQTRSFQYVDDCVEGIVRMMERDGSWPGPVNIGNPVEYTIGDLAKMVIDLTGGEGDVMFKPLPTDDPRVRQPDIALATEKLSGWTPVVPLEEGLPKLIASFRALGEDKLRKPKVERDEKVLLGGLGASE